MPSVHPVTVSPIHWSRELCLMLPFLSTLGRLYIDSAGESPAKTPQPCIISGEMSQATTSPAVLVRVDATEDMSFALSDVEHSPLNCGLADECRRDVAVCRREFVLRCRLASALLRSCKSPARGNVDHLFPFDGLHHRFGRCQS